MKKLIAQFPEDPNDPIYQTDGEQILPCFSSYLARACVDRSRRFGFQNLRERWMMYSRTCIEIHKLNVFVITLLPELITCWIRFDGKPLSTSSKTISESTNAHSSLTPMGTSSSAIERNRSTYPFSTVVARKVGDSFTWDMGECRMKLERTLSL